MIVVVVDFICAVLVVSGAIVLWVPIIIHSREITFLSVTVKGDKIGVYLCALVLAQGM